MTNSMNIEDRRRKVQALSVRSANENEIAEKLNVSQATVSRDVRYLKAQAQKYVYDLAKNDLCYAYKQSIDAIQEVTRQAWQLYDNNINMQVKLMALKLVKECEAERFMMFKDGPSFMHLKALQEKVDIIESRSGFGQA
jgi:IS30 family transposase